MKIWNTHEILWVFHNRLSMKLNTSMKSLVAWIKIPCEKSIKPMRKSQMHMQMVIFEGYSYMNTYGYCTCTYTSGAMHSVYCTLCHRLILSLFFAPAFHSQAQWQVTQQFWHLHQWRMVCPVPRCLIRRKLWEFTYLTCLHCVLRHIPCVSDH